MIKLFATAVLVAVLVILDLLKNWKRRKRDRD